MKIADSVVRVTVFMNGLRIHKLYGVYVEIIANTPYIIAPFAFREFVSFSGA